MKYIWLFHRMIVMSNRSHPNPISRAAVILTENGRSKTCVTLSSTIQPDFITDQSSIGVKIFFFVPTTYILFIPFGYKIEQMRDVWAWNNFPFLGLFRWSYRRKLESSDSSIFLYVKNEKRKSCL